jgi:hypothetical protein
MTKRPRRGTFTIELTSPERFLRAALPLICCGLLASACVLAGGLTPKKSADLILTHGEIYTPKGWAEAVAIGSAHRPLK